MSALGKNTENFFEQLQLPLPTALEVTALRNDIVEWDRSYAFSYPKGIASDSFIEEKIGEVSASVYKARDVNPSTPTVLFFHGGGFFCELKNVHRSLMANIAARIKCHGILPHYSLAPENKISKAINEATSVLRSLLANPKEHGMTDNVIVIGYSSGGNLVWNAVLNILNSPEARELAEKISHLFLMSPWTDLSLAMTKIGPYQSQQAVDKMLQLWGLEQMRDWCLPSGATGMEPQYSPLYRPTTEMKGMPETTVIVGEFDRLLNDSVETVRLLKNAGVAAQLFVLEGQSHNHSAHSALRDGVFTPDIIAAVVQGDSVRDLKGGDGLGILFNLGEQHEKPSYRASGI